jgi:hypothetical protein
MLQLKRDLLRHVLLEFLTSVVRKTCILVYLGTIC